MGIGISKPAARRLLETVKKRKGTLKKKIIQTFINSSGNTKERPSIERIVEHPNQLDTNTLTCLIKESVSHLNSDFCLFEWYNSELLDCYNYLYPFVYRI